MSKLRATVGVVLLSISLSGVAIVANDWPQWRGPSETVTLVRRGYSRSG